MKNIAAILYLVVISAFHASAQSQNEQNYKDQILPGDSLVKDFIFFCDMLEETHPDPYSGFGGRPYFRLQRDVMIDQIANDSLDVDDFCDILNEFTVPLKDIHTFVQYPQSDAPKIKYVQRIAFNVLNDGLMVSGIAKPYSKYLGSRLLAINNVPVDTLAERMTKIKPSENQFGNLQNLSSWGNQDEILNRLGIQFNDSIHYSLLTIASDTVCLDLPIVEREHIADVEMARLNSTLTLPQDNLQFAFIDPDDKMMYFRLSSVMARENYKYCYEKGWNNAMDDIAYYYKSIGREMPENIEDAINAIPSFSEEFSKMLKSMKKKGSEYLIIDLRGNGGGWTPITQPSMMMMFGDDYFGKDFDIKSIRLLSNLYLRKLNQTIEQLNQSWGTQCEIGDYITMKEYHDGDIATLRDQMLQNAMTETPELLKSLNGAPLYRPKQIFVITDPHTNSAAFHYAFYLGKMGATLVGVPSSQAPNTFMEVTPFKLPYTGLVASASNTMQQFFPADSPYAKTLKPDIGITSSDYHSHNIDSNTPVLKVLEICGIAN